MADHRFSDTDRIFKDKCNLFFAKCSEHIRLQIQPRRKNLIKNFFLCEFLKKNFFQFTNSKKKFSIFHKKKVFYHFFFRGWICSLMCSEHFAKNRLHLSLKIRSVSLKR